MPHNPQEIPPDLSFLQPHARTRLCPSELPQAGIDEQQRCHPSPAPSACYWEPMGDPKGDRSTVHVEEQSRTGGDEGMRLPLQSICRPRREGGQRTMTQITLTLSTPLGSQFVAAQSTGHAGQASTSLQCPCLCGWLVHAYLNPPKSILKSRINLLFLPQNLGIGPPWTLFAARERNRHLEKALLPVPRGLQHKAGSTLKRLIFLPFTGTCLVSDTGDRTSESPPLS